VSRTSARAITSHGSGVAVPECRSECFVSRKAEARLAR
jgi:hypothetical protein